MPSPRVLEDAARRDHDVQDRRADALDTKAGLLLGFSGLLLVSVTPGSVWAPLGLLARLVATGAAALSLRAVVVRLPDAPPWFALPGTGAMVRDVWLDGVYRVTQHRALALDRKWWRIRASVALLVAALVTIAVGTTVAAVLEWRSG